MILNAAGAEVTRWNQRAIGVAVITFALLVHGIVPKWGIRFQNLLGIFKIAVLLVIIISGFVALGGHVKSGAPHPSNFKNAFAGTKSDANSFVNAMYNVIWSFIGYSNIFYALSEVKEPIKVVKRAAPLALVFVTILYMVSKTCESNLPGPLQYANISFSISSWSILPSLPPCPRT